MKKLLIIEDDQNILTIYREKFVLEGFEVMTASTGKEGLFAAQSKNPDLILLDIMLPGGMNGFDVLEQMKKDDRLKKIPVMILTNLDSEEKVAKQIGANEYFVKSNTTIDELVKKVKSYF